MDYQERIAQTDSDVLHEQRLAELVAGLCDRIAGGESLDLDVICQLHPTFEADLRDLWGTILMTQSVGEDAPSRPEPGTGPASPLPLFDLPYRMGRFILHEEIGRGGMGVVYRAERVSDGKTVAVKMMLKGELATRIDRERFEAETTAAAGMDHPGIVPIHEVGEHLGRPWFSMDLIRGQTLSQILANGPLSGLRAARLMKQIAEAVEHAHENGILHRDLKPSNILVDDKDRAWVCDFGLAKNAATTSASLTRTGAVIGTPAYMAPEQAAGARGQVGPVTDVYGLGAILYHMLTGRPPFQAATPVDTVLMVLEQDPLLPRVLNRNIDRPLEMITMRCLQKPQDLRYQTAGWLAADLAAYLANRPVSASEGRFRQMLAGLFRETHHAAVLQNWGQLWMWHSLVVLVASFLTNLMYLGNVTSQLIYELVWGIGFAAWAGVFWHFRRRMGPVTFVERQIAHVWAASVIGIAVLFPFERFLQLPLLRLAPVLSVIAGMTFLVKAGILSGSFYIQAAALFLNAALMAAFPDHAMFLFGIVCSGCFFFPGLKYHRQRIQSGRSLD